MSVIIVRNPSIDDAEHNALRAAAWNRDCDRIWGPILARSLGWAGALDGDRLIGFVYVAWDGGPHAFLLDPTVHPDFQHQGIGQALVREATAIAQEGGCEWLHVDYDNELDAFYQSCGFRPTLAGLIKLAR
jgi:ribosomal protein S18 acetylase RimI-like enzyme